MLGIKSLHMKFIHVTMATVLRRRGDLLVAGVRAEIIEQILVKVNGEIFTKTELESRQVAALRQSWARRPIRATSGCGRCSTR